MPSDKYAAWVKTFRKAAALDNYEAFKELLEGLDLEAVPETLVDGTINLVRMSAAYAHIDNQPISKLLAAQAYNPTLNLELPYILTFDICGKAYGRLFVDADLKMIDLADLYGTPWEDYRVVGYYQIWITRSDGRALSNKEIDDLEEMVRNDIYFDYTEEDVEIQADSAEDSLFLRLTIFDV